MVTLAYIALLALAMMPDPVTRYTLQVTVAPVVLHKCNVVIAFDPELAKILAAVPLVKRVICIAIFNPIRK